MVATRALRAGLSTVRTSRVRIAQKDQHYPDTLTTQADHSLKTKKKQGLFKLLFFFL